MKNIMSLFVIIIIAFSLSALSYAQEKQQTKKETSSVKTEINKPVNTICPVSTEQADAEITYEYKGKTYALCCNSCLKKFKKDPEKYISRLSEDGKSIKSKKGDEK